MKNKIRFAGVKKLLLRWVQRPEYVYAVIGTVGVICFSFVTPPFQGPDESFHFVRAQYIAQGKILPVDVKKENASLPVSIDKVIDTTFPADGIVGKPWEKYDIGQTKAALKIPLNADETYQPPMISYTALAYLPAIPGIAVSNMLNLSPLVSMYLARISLGLASVLLIFLAVKSVPYKKHLFMVIALTPMMLFQQSMVSIDGVSYALLIAFICYLLYLYKQVSITNKEWFLLGAICLAIVLAKPLVFLFLPLVLILANKKRALLWISAFAAVCVIALTSVTLYNASKDEGVTDVNTPVTTNSSLQIENLQNNPKRFLRVMWNTYMTEYGDDKVRGIIGIFGPADTKYPLWMLLGYVVMIGYFALIRFTDDENPVPRSIKFIAAILGLVYFTLVNLVIYISFSPVNFDIVYGVQGRYFLPMLIVLPILTHSVLRFNSKKMSDKFLLYCNMVMALLVALAIFIVLQRYYLYTA